MSIRLLHNQGAVISSHTTDCSLVDLLMVGVSTFGMFVRSSNSVSAGQFLPVRYYLSTGRIRISTPLRPIKARVAPGNGRNAVK